MDYLAFWQKNQRRNLWQHPIWMDFQEAIGRKVWSLQNKGASALVIQHDMPKGLNWLEIPRGPLFKDTRSLNKLLDEIKELGRKEKSVFVRLSPFKKLKIKNLKIAKHDNQPQTSLIIDLDQTDEEILGQMKPKGRYNIKVAQRHGVIVKPSNDVSIFYQMLESTGFRDHFGIHPKSYYQKMLSSMPKNAQLLLADYNGEVIAGGIFVYLDEWGIYYYGASVWSYRNVMAPYLLQWEAIKEAKKRGCKHYDFLGIAPENAKYHPWSGVTEFKKKFGGQVKNYPQAKEMILRPIWYCIYRIYKKLR
jgi:lipid II:glycine glycyltransferase (peptidoglycan interpeptide bridge formation enzyme)